MKNETGRDDCVQCYRIQSKIKEEEATNDIVLLLMLVLSNLLRIEIKWMSKDPWM